MIYLLRHGETQYNIEDRFLGQTDIGLCQEGIITFENIANQLLQKSFIAIYCSQYQRSQQSAQILSSKLNIPYFTCKDLGERYLGILDGQRRKDSSFERYVTKLMDLNFSPPKGEKGSDCLRRFINAFEKIVLNAKGDILVISHGGVIALYSRIILNASKHRAFLDNGSFHILTVNKQGKIQGEKFNQKFEKKSNN